MDAKKTSHGRSRAKPESTPLEIRQCRYCKGKFEVDPKFPHKQFCSDSHRKLYWRYGSQSIGKVAQKVDRDMRKLIAAELAPLRTRLAEAERAIDALVFPLPNAGEPAAIDWETIDRNRKAKRGGGAAA